MTVTRKRAVGLGRTVLVLAACLLLAACGRVELHANLDERQANEVLAVLLANGVDADKRNSIASDTGYQIRVGKSDVPRSMAMLAARGLPRAKLRTLCDVFERKGFVSSATEERARQQCGWEQDLTYTLSMYPGVAEARVHLALAERDPIGGTSGEASAAVLIFEQAGANVRNQEHHFKVMVKDAVPGLENPNQVSVKFATLPAPGEMLPDQRSQAPVMSAMSPVTLAIAAGVIAVLALLVAFGNRLRVRLQGKQAPDDRIWKG
jgi:type III secretion protein J